MYRFWIILAAICLLCGPAWAEEDWTPQQRAAMDSLDARILAEEQAQFRATLAEAETGDISAKYYLGTLYIAGSGVEMDEETGFSLISQAADQGFAEAQNWMGDFEAARALDYDYTAALNWWRLAAAQGLPDAQLSVGQCYEQGLNVPQSDSTAAYWYRLAAEGGSSDARFSISQCYLSGVGVPQDYQEALFWILLVFPGSWDAGYSSIERIAMYLTEAERQSVETRARAWLEEHPR